MPYITKVDNERIDVEVDLDYEQYVKLPEVMGCKLGDLGKFKGNRAETRYLSLTIDDRLCPNGIAALQRFLEGEGVAYRILKMTEVNHTPA